MYVTTGQAAANWAVLIERRRLDQSGLYCCYYSIMALGQPRQRANIEILCRLAHCQVQSGCHVTKYPAQQNRDISRTWPGEATSRQVKDDRRSSNRVGIRIGWIPVIRACILSPRCPHQRVLVARGRRRSPLSLVCVSYGASYSSAVYKCTLCMVAWFVGRVLNKVGRYFVPT
jgi:hypothetical protein